MIPYIWVYIWSWHTWPAQKVATSCTRFYVQNWRWIGKIFNSDPCELILLHWFFRWYLYLFKVSCRAEVVTSPHKSVTATSGLTSSGCRPHTSSVWPWSGESKVHLYGTFIGGLRHSCWFKWRNSITCTHCNVISLEHNWIPWRANSQRNNVDTTPIHFLWQLYTIIKIISRRLELDGGSKNLPKSNQI